MQLTSEEEQLIYSTHFEVQNVQFSFILGNLPNPNMSIIRKLQCVCM